MKKSSQPKMTDLWKSKEKKFDSTTNIDLTDTTPRLSNTVNIEEGASTSLAVDTAINVSKEIDTAITDHFVPSSIVPTDISPMASIERTVTSITLKSFVFPKTKFGGDQKLRSFQLIWLEKFNWVEYSVSQNAAYCFPCRKFDGKDTKEQAFSTTGYSNWKKALQKNTGFYKHESSLAHKNAMLSWSEQRKRDQMNVTVTEMLSNAVLQKRRYYMKNVIEVIIFVIENELALRGNWDKENNIEEGVFRNLFEFQLKHNEELRMCQSVMPQNATYLSPDIQNELISLLSKMVQEKIVDDMIKADVEYFTIYVDGTKDRKNKECVSIATRYIKSGQPQESLLLFYTIKELDAESNAKKILEALKESGLDLSNILTQCYDGASVMSGDDGGIQRKIQDILDRIIPYVHCFNHRLHLVVIAATDGIEMVRLFFENIKLIYNFFRRSKIQSLYEGSLILNLITIRWAGHVRATNAVFENYDEIVNTLPKVTANTKYNFDGDDIALANGILNTIQKIEFVFMLHFMKEFLGLILPADKILQSRDVGFREAVPVIDSVVSEVKKLRINSSFDRIWESCKEKLDKSKSTTGSSSRPSRDKKRSSKLSQYIVTDSIGERNTNVKVEIESAYYEVIDIFVSEMERRFKENSDILMAVSDSTEFSLEKLKPLEKLGIELPPEEELIVAKAYIDRKKREHDDERIKNNQRDFKTRFNMLQELYAVKDAFPQVYRFMATIEIFGSSTTICECSFSALERIGSKRRMNMDNERLRNLTFLAFEYKRLGQISVEDVLKRFDQNPLRKIQLY